MASALCPKPDEKSNIKPAEIDGLTAQFSCYKIFKAFKPTSTIPATAPIMPPNTEPTGPTYI